MAESTAKDVQKTEDVTRHRATFNMFHADRPFADWSGTAWFPDHLPRNSITFNVVPIANPSGVMPTAITGVAYGTMNGADFYPLGNIAGFGPVTFTVAAVGIQVRIGTFTGAAGTGYRVQALGSAT